MGLRAYIEVEVTTDVDKGHLSPSFGGYALMVGGKELQFDFNQMEGGFQQEGSKLVIAAHQKELDTEAYLKDWIERGFIQGEPSYSYQKMCDMVYEAAKAAESVSEVYVEVWNQNTEDHLDAEIRLREFSLYDPDVFGTQISLMDKKFDETTIKKAL